MDTTMVLSLLHASSVLHFLGFSVLHTCNLVERVTDNETCTTQNYLWSAKPWVRAGHRLLPSHLHQSLPINTACSQKQLLASLPEWVQHLPSTWGCSLEPPAPPWPTSPTAQECPLQLKLTASSGETQEICVAFQTLKQRSQRWVRQLLVKTFLVCSCTLKSLPEAHAMVNTPSARGTATANKKVRTHRNMAKIKFCIILGEKKNL